MNCFFFLAASSLDLWPLFVCPRAHVCVFQICLNASAWDIKAVVGRVRWGIAKGEREEAFSFFLSFCLARTLFCLSEKSFVMEAARSNDFHFRRVQNQSLLLLRRRRRRRWRWRRLCQNWPEPTFQGDVCRKRVLGHRTAISYFDGPKRPKLFVMSHFHLPI